MENQAVAGSEKAHPPPLPSKEESSLPPSGGDYVPYPKIDPRDLEPQHAPQTFSSGTNAEPAPATNMPSNSNPYTTSSPAAPKFADSVRGALGKFKIKVGEAAKTTEDLAGNVWQHLKTGPSMADAAMGMITEGTKVIAEGGYEKIFQKTFDTIPGEKLKTNYACFLSTSAGPVRGIIYLSTAKIAFTSDNPLSYKVADKTEWSYYKVVIPLNQLRSVNPSSSKSKPAEKYIQIISVDDHEFWFMGFVNYESAVTSIQESLIHDLQIP